MQLYGCLCYYSPLSLSILKAGSAPACLHLACDNPEACGPEAMALRSAVTPKYLNQPPGTFTSGLR